MDHSLIVLISCQQGTFSGLWPKWPRFWENDDPANPADIGRTILANAVAWLEDLAESDPVAFQGFRALSPMNEPAHLAGLFNPGESKAYLPNLPADLEAPFLKSLHQHQGTEVQSGPHLRVLLWLSQSVETFRNSKLPQLGKEIHVNIHESVFRSSDLPEDPNGETGVAAAHVVAAWWSTATSSAERSSWAILDMHHYHAWDEPCAGTSDGLGNYTCGDDVSRSITLQRCAAWASNVYRRAVDDECGPGARLASAEFSASTHHQVHRACNDIGTLHATYAAQVEDAKSADVELFFWSWKMPYGDSFRNAWSFKHLMYLLGVTSQPDESNYQCGVPVLFEDLPSDDLFSN